MAAPFKVESPLTRFLHVALYTSVCTGGGFVGEKALESSNLDDRTSGFVGEKALRVLNVSGAFSPTEPPP